MGQFHGVMKPQTPMGSRGWNPDYPDALNQLAFCPGEKVGLRVNWKAEAAPDLAALCKQAMVELDETKRKQASNRLGIAGSRLANLFFDATRNFVV